MQMTRNQSAPAGLHNAARHSWSSPRVFQFTTTAVVRIIAYRLSQIAYRRKTKAGLHPDLMRHGDAESQILCVSPRLASCRLRLSGLFHV